MQHSTESRPANSRSCEGRVHRISYPPPFHNCLPYKHSDKHSDCSPRTSARIHWQGRTGRRVFPFFRAHHERRDRETSNRPAATKLACPGACPIECSDESSSQAFRLARLFVRRSAPAHELSNGSRQNKANIPVLTRTASSQVSAYHRHGPL